MDYTELSRRYAGKRLLRSEILIDDPLFEHLLNTYYFSPKPAIQKKWSHYQCQRCGNQKQSLFGEIPCCDCKRTHLYCRKCIETGRVMECLSLYEWAGPEPDWPSLPNACTWTGELTQSQQKAADRIIQAIQSREKELLTWAVCGSGKTEMLFPGITEALKIGKRICIATPRTDVVRELLPRLREAFSGVYIQGLYGGSLEKDGTAQLIIATTHQLLRFKHAFDVMIIDEVDAFPFTHDPTLSFAAVRAKKEVSTTIYLTATPRQEHQTRMAKQKLPHVFVPKRFHGHPLPVPAFRMSYALKKDLQKSYPPKAFFKWFASREISTRQLLIFVPTIKLAKRITEKLSAILTDHTMTAVHSTDHDREEKIRQFRNKQFQILVTTTILERGVTFPSVDVTVFDAGHPVFDEAALVQIAGRAGRSPEDPTGEVVFFHDGKTEAMVQAVRAIIKMNKRGGFR
ncbi:competence protein ComFA [Lentibacillus halodurans]|uniref:Competence protein ComFA n=1 Tax=Lentibacillus halodurans TaxID=237679 RepID=A0A1I0WHT8_9BACI|nr:DEAD/DEAH box helicase [Lentibacillus halodurans]SFA88124.1 competence protein ComFA [Lentibacillus halodurans]